MSDVAVAAPPAGFLPAAAANGSFVAPAAEEAEEAGAPRSPVRGQQEGLRQFGAFGVEAPAGGARANQGMSLLQKVVTALAVAAIAAGIALVVAYPPVLVAGAVIASVGAVVFFGSLALHRYNQNKVQRQPEAARAREIVAENQREADEAEAEATRRLAAAAAAAAAASGARRPAANS